MLRPDRKSSECPTGGIQRHREPGDGTGECGIQRAGAELPTDPGQSEKVGLRSPRSDQRRRCRPGKTATGSGSARPAATFRPVGHLVVPAAARHDSAYGRNPPRPGAHPDESLCTARLGHAGTVHRRLAVLSRRLGRPSQRQRQYGRTGRSRHFRVILFQHRQPAHRRSPFVF